MLAVEIRKNRFDLREIVRKVLDVKRGTQGSIRFGSWQRGTGQSSAALVSKNTRGTYAFLNFLVATHIRKPKKLVNTNFKIMSI